MKTINLYYKHFIVLILFLFLSNIFVDYLFSHHKKNYLSIQTETLEKRYETQYRYLKIMSSDIFIMYQENEKLIALFEQAEGSDDIKRAKIRKSIYEMLKKRYSRLTNMGVKQVHFHLPNNISFLRMHSPSKFGDDLTGFRESVVMTNSTQTSTEGFEIGKVANGFRYVYPMYGSKKQYIGSLEVSFDGNFLLENLLGKLVLEKRFLILKSEINKNHWIDFILDSYTDSPEHQDYLLTLDNLNKSKSDKIQKLFNNSELYKDVKQMVGRHIAFSVDAKLDEKSVIITFLPIKNLRKKIAYITIYSNSDHLEKIFLERMYIKILLFSIIILLFLFSIYATIVHFKLLKMALIDKLTGLHNRAYFYSELELEVQRVKRTDVGFSIFFIDLDGFKNVNDTFGHNVGDELLVQVSARLKSLVREVDIVGRIGGDEFTILVTNIKEDRDVSLVAQKIVKSLNEPFFINRNKVQIGASIGISFFPKDAEDVESLVKKADSAMYEAKNSGKNHFVIYKGD